MMATTANAVVIVVVVTSVTVAIVIIPVAVIALGFVLCCPLVLSLHRLAVACCFTSVAGIAARPSFG
jgi:hypothetical protein